MPITASCLCRLCAVLGASLISAPALAESYAYTLLINADGREIYPTALNSLGQVVGGGYLNEGPGSAVQHGFLWSNGVVSQIDFGENASNTPAGINDTGLVIGTYQAGPGEQALAFTYDTVSGATKALNSNPKFSVSGLGINSAGMTVGGISPYPQTNPSRYQGFVASLKGRVHAFSPAPMSVAQALRINDSGDIVGAYQLRKNLYQSFGFVGQNNVFTTISVPGAMTTNPTFINNDGTIGGSYIDPNNHVRGFLYKSGAYTLIDYPNSIETFVIGMSGNGTIFGNVQLQDGHVGFIDIKGNFEKIRLPGYQQTSIVAANARGDFIGVANSTRHRSATFVAQCKAMTGQCN